MTDHYPLGQDDFTNRSAMGELPPAPSRPEQRVPTKVVVNPNGGYMIINASDFDPAKHTEFNVSEAQKPVATKKTSTPKE